jgi:hypothetical protein
MSGKGRTATADWDADKLERAAKHMRELDASTNARAAIELAKREQDVEIARENAKAKEAEVQRAHALKEAERVRWEEQRRTLEAKRENEKVSGAGSSATGKMAAPQPRVAKARVRPG